MWVDSLGYLPNLIFFCLKWSFKMPVINSHGLDLSKIDLSSLGINTQPVTTPVPAPSPIKDILPTDFELSPFLEKVTVDPYSTVELGILNQAELAIDSVVDYVESVLPPELIDGIKGLPGLAQQLLLKGQNLEQFLLNLQNRIPRNLSLVNILRMSGVLNTVNHLETFLYQARQIGITVENLPAVFTTNGLSFMGQMSHFFDISSITNQIKGSLDFNAARGYPANHGGGYTYSGNPIAKAGVALATVSLSTTTPTSISNTLRNLGITNATNALPLLNNSTSTQVSIIATATQASSITTVSNLVNTINSSGYTNTSNLITAIGTSTSPNIYKNVANIVTQLGKTDATTLIGVINSNPTAAATVANGINTYGISTVTNLVAQLQTLGLTVLTQLFNDIAGIQPTIMLGIITEVEATSIAAYITAHGSTNNGTVLTDIQNHGITLIANLNTLLDTIGITYCISLINGINTLTITNANTLLTLATTHGANTISTDMGLIGLETTSNLNTALAQVTLMGSNNVISVSDTINALNAANATVLTNNLNGLDSTAVISALPILSNLNSTQLTTLSTQINSNNEPTSILTSAGLSGDYLIYATKKAMEVGAKAGNYRIVLDLINNYAGTISTDYLYYIVVTLLSNYSNNEDDAAMGRQTVSRFFGSALYQICPSFDMVIRNGESIFNQSPFITASMDSLNTLVYYPLTAIACQLELDNKYTLVHV